MKRLLAASLALIAVAATLALGADSVLFRYRLQPQSTYEQAMTMGMTIRMDVEGMTPEQAAALGGFAGQDIGFNMTTKMSMQTGAKAGDGTIPIEMRVAGSEVRMKMGGNETPIPVPPIEQVIRGKLAADGRLVEIDLSGVEGGEGVPRELLDRLSQITPPLPVKAMRVGDTIDVPVSFDAPVPMAGPGGQMKLDGKTVFTLRSIGAKEADFDVKMTLALDTQAAEGAALTMKMTGGGDGAATFDVEEGIFSKMNLAVDLKMDMTGGGGAAAEGGTGQPIRMKMSMTGPMEVTMSRVPATR